MAVAYFGPLLRWIYTVDGGEREQFLEAFDCLDLRSWDESQG
jgi:hypothetical protein